MISRFFIDRPIFASVLSIVITLAGADRHRDPALGGDPPIRQQGAQAGDRAGPDLDDQRRGEHPGQERHEPPPSR